jgi:hypothetical protein
MALLLAGLPEGFDISLESQNPPGSWSVSQASRDFCADGRMLVVLFRMTAVTLAPAAIISE